MLMVKYKAQNFVLVSTIVVYVTLKQLFLNSYLKTNLY